MVSSVASICSALSGFHALPPLLVSDMVHHPAQALNYYDGVGNKLRMYTGLSSPLAINGLDSVTAGSDTDYSVTKYEYDRFGNLTKMTDPLNQEENYQYDLNGNLTQETDRNGSVTVFTYDGLNRVLTRSVTNTQEPSLNQSYSYTYTLAGNRVSMSGGGINTTYTYDDLGRLITETEANGIVKEYTYDAAGNRKSLTVKKDGAVKTSTTYTYDKLNRLYQVLEGGQTVSTYTYDDNGNRASLTYSNGNLTEYQYNLANKLTTLTNKNGVNILSQYTYTYFLDGNQADKTETVTNKSTEYVYDGLSRLVTETEKDNGVVTGSIGYTYDDYNNRQSMTVAGGAVTTYAYDLNNRLTTEVKVTGDITDTTRYSYDNNGNQIYKATETEKPAVGAEVEGYNLYVSGDSAGSTGVTFNEYDGFNQLVKTTIADKSITYAYNGDGLRTSKTVNGTATVHVWDGGQIVLELDGAGAVTSKYVRGINLLYAEDGAGANRKWYLFNGHGDVVQLTGIDGNVTKTYDYDAFGNEKDPDANDTNVFRYCGEYFDKDVKQQVNPPSLNHINSPC